MKPIVKISIALGLALMSVSAYFYFNDSHLLRTHLPKNATFCIEFNLKQIFQKIDISDPNQTKDIADFFNSELEEDPRF